MGWGCASGQTVFLGAKILSGPIPKTVSLEFNQVLMNGGLISPQLKVCLALFQKVMHLAPSLTRGREGEKRTGKKKENGERAGSQRHLAVPVARGKADGDTAGVRVERESYAYYYLLAGARGLADETFRTNCWRAPPGHEITAAIRI